MTTRKMLPILILVLLAGVNLYAKDHTVWLSYYGTTDFDVQPAVVHVAPGDVIHYQTDGPGTLILRLDNGKVYHSDTGEITLTAEQLQANGLVRCSMITEDGVLVGWETDHQDRFGSHCDDGSGTPCDRHAVSWLLAALITLGLL